MVGCPNRPVAAGERLRIVQVFNRYLEAGGEARSVERMAGDLEAAGHRVLRFWRATSEWSADGTAARLKRPFLMVNNRKVLADLRRLDEQERPHFWLLHNVLPVISLGVFRLAREVGAPVIQWLHNYRPLSPSGSLFAQGRRLDPRQAGRVWREVLAGRYHGPLATAWLALTYARLRWRGDFESVRAWVAISEGARRVFAEAGWYPDRLRVLRHAWHIRPDSPRPSEDDGSLLFLGRMVEEKGVRFLVNLWQRPELRQRRLVLAGTGPWEARLRRAPGANIEWVGPLAGEEKQRFLARCRAVLVPSLWEEPLGLVTYEAYEQARPVLASRMGGLPETVFDGVTGRLLPPGDMAAWSQAILALDRPAAVRLGAAGRRWLEQNTSPARWVQGFEELVRPVLG